MTIKRLVPKGLSSEARAELVADIDRSKQRTRRTCAVKHCTIAYLTSAYDPQPICRACRLEAEAHAITPAVQKLQDRQAHLLRESEIVRRQLMQWEGGRK